MAVATSFATRTVSPERVGRELAEALGRVTRPSGALVFAGGALAERLPEIAEAMAKAGCATPALVVGGAGVLSDRGEIEGDASAAGVVWTGGRTETLCVAASTPDEAATGLARALSDRTAQSSPTAIVFLRPDGIGPSSLEPLQTARTTAHVFGAGTVGSEPIAIDAEGRASSGRAVAMLLRGLSPPAVRSSSACRLLMPLRRVTETRGALVTRIEGEPALDVLSSAAQALEDQPLVFAVLAGEEAGDGRPELLVRAVQGVDPVRRGLLVSDEVEPGTRIAFAVRDGATARADLEAAAREVQRAMAGAAPRFGVYVNCAGRGASLYGAPDVDTKILRARFSGTPFAGLQSSFEIAPYHDQPTLQLYTGVLALFSAPS